MRHVKLVLLMGVVALLGASSLVQAQTNVTFQVDMRVHIGLGNFDPAAQGVSAVGSHNGWGGADLAANALTDADGDSIYTATIGIDAGDYEYKFVVTSNEAIDAWESSDNRALSIGAPDTTFALSEWAQGIKFSVDMTAPLAGGAMFNPDTQYVAVVGSHNGWGGASRDASEMTDADGDNIYEGRYPVGDHEAKYKFTIRNNSDDAVATWENHPDRALTDVGLDPAETITVPWDSDPGTSFDANVTFQVDMGVHMTLGTFDPATQGISAVGSHNGWGGADLDANALADDDGDGVYTATIVVESGTINYKYVVTEGAPTTLANWESSPDRELAIETADTTVGITEWAQGVLFKVDMTPPLAGGAALDSDNQYVAIVGSHNGWGGAARDLSEMSDSDGDNVYEGRYGVGAADVKFKFTIRNNSDDAVATWESHADRSLTELGFGLDPAELAVTPWDSDPGQAVDATLLFQVDVTPIRDLGLFDETDGDSLVVFGGFNGWNGASLDESLMRQSLTDPAIFELALPVSRVPGSELEYKFFIKFNQSSSRFTDNPPPSGWEEPGSTGGGNRLFGFSSEVQQVVGVQTFNDIFTVVPKDTMYTMNFTADMTCALRDPNFGDVTTDTLFMDIGDPFWHFFNGTLGDDGESRPSFAFEDADGDSIYTASITVKGPIPNWVQYKLNWAGIDEAGPGFSLGRRRVRYARAIPDSTNADGDPAFEAEYSMGVDVWNDDNARLLTVETEEGGPIDDQSPCITTGVALTDPTIPESYNLSNNFPNPFNPATKIVYTIPRAGEVKLTLYNILGKVVAELVNEYQQAGTYEVTVDFTQEFAFTPPSGIYFYRIEAGNFVDTKSMVLLK